MRASDLVRMSLGEIHLNLYLNVYAAVNSWWVLVAGAEVQNTAFYTMMGLDRNCSDADIKRQLHTHTHTSGILIIMRIT